MTLGFEELEVGETVEFKGPLGSFEWLGRGSYRWRGEERRASHVGMVCAGSGTPPFFPSPLRGRALISLLAGITPILQVLRGILLDPEDSDTKVHVVNANRTEEDILMRAELDSLLRQAGPDRFRQHLVLSQPPSIWAHSRGRVSREHLVEHLPPPTGDGLVLMCAPPALQDAVKAHLAELGWDVEKQVVIF